ncbi:MAG: NAD(P)H-dependent oxidoreductase [Dehalococcoidia bacterium]|nr:NAD(P)H-dependent oxidoreductase [Dehalococcoidia bacterium]
MKIAVLNGSPKGDISVTMQYVHFIQKKFPQHKLKILNVSQRIKTTEKNQAVFQEIIDEVRLSDGILWAFPLYVFLVHSQYKRFIELIWENGAADAFKSKYTAALSTSIHFFDHAAHNYMNAICDDLDMKYVGSYSADMRDLLEEKERDRLVLFAENFFEAIETNVPTTKSYKPVTYGKFNYVPGNVETKTDIGDKKVIVVTDCQDKQANLGRMIETFRESLSKEVQVINLNDIDIKGGCLGCIQCGFDNICAYQDKDEFIEFYNTKIKTADVLIFAGAIRDRYLSSRWKLFFDRGFFNTHTPTLTGKQVGFIVSGPLSQIPNLRQILEAYIEWQRANLVDFVTDEYEDSAKVDALLQSLAKRAVRFAEIGYVKPATFLGVGGMKIFRDDMWGRLRFVFQADHRYYKKHGIYDFPQKDRRARDTNKIMFDLTKTPEMREQVRKMIKTQMVKPYQEILED